MSDYQRGITDSDRLIRAVWDVQKELAEVVKQLKIANQLSVASIRMQGESDPVINEILEGKYL